MSGLRTMTHRYNVWCGGEVRNRDVTFTHLISLIGIYTPNIIIIILLLILLPLPCLHSITICMPPQRLLTLLGPQNNCCWMCPINSQKATMVKRRIICFGTKCDAEFFFYYFDCSSASMAWSLIPGIPHGIGSMGWNTWWEPQIDSPASSLPLLGAQH